MKFTQKPQTKQNAAWRAFWIKIREMDARETGSRVEKGVDNRSELPITLDRPAGLVPISKEQEKH